MLLHFAENIQSGKKYLLSITQAFKALIWQHLISTVLMKCCGSKLGENVSGERGGVSETAENQCAKLGWEG